MSVYAAYEITICKSKSCAVIALDPELNSIYTTGDITVGCSSARSGDQHTCALSIDGNVFHRANNVFCSVTAIVGFNTVCKSIALNSNVLDITYASGGTGLKNDTANGLVCIALTLNVNYKVLECNCIPYLDCRSIACVNDSTVLNGSITLNAHTAIRIACSKSITAEVKSNSLRNCELIGSVINISSENDYVAFRSCSNCCLKLSLSSYLNLRYLSSSVYTVFINYLLAVNGSNITCKFITVQVKIQELGNYDIFIIICHQLNGNNLTFIILSAISSLNSYFKRCKVISIKCRYTAFSHDILMVILSIRAELLTAKHRVERLVNHFSIRILSQIHSTVSISCFNTIPTALRTAACIHISVVGHTAVVDYNILANSYVVKNGLIIRINRNFTDQHTAHTISVILIRCGNVIVSIQTACYSNILEDMLSRILNRTNYTAQAGVKGTPETRDYSIFVNCNILEGHGAAATGITNDTRSTVVVGCVCRILNCNIFESTIAPCTACDCGNVTALNEALCIFNCYIFDRCIPNVCKQTDRAIVIPIIAQRPTALVHILNGMALTVERAFEVRLVSTDRIECDGFSVRAHLIQIDVVHELNDNALKHIAALYASIKSLEIIPGSDFDNFKFVPLSIISLYGLTESSICVAGALGVVIPTEEFSIVHICVLNEMEVSAARSVVNQIEVLVRNTAVEVVSITANGIRIIIHSIKEQNVVSTTDILIAGTAGNCSCRSAVDELNNATIGYQSTRINFTRVVNNNVTGICAIIRNKPCAIGIETCADTGCMSLAICGYSDSSGVLTSLKNYLKSLTGSLIVIATENTSCAGSATAKRCDRTGVDTVLELNSSAYSNVIVTLASTVHQAKNTARFASFRCYVSCVRAVSDSNINLRLADLRIHMSDKTTHIIGSINSTTENVTVLNYAYSLMLRDIIADKCCDAGTEDVLTCAILTGSAVNVNVRQLYVGNVCSVNVAKQTKAVLCTAGFSSIRNIAGRTQTGNCMISAIKVTGEHLNTIGSRSLIIVTRTNRCPTYACKINVSRQLNKHTFIGLTCVDLVTKCNKILKVSDFQISLKFLIAVWCICCLIF